MKRLLIILSVLMFAAQAMASDKIKVAGIYTQPIQQKWDACLHKALQKSADAGDIDYV